MDHLWESLSLRVKVSNDSRARLRLAYVSELAQVALVLLLFAVKLLLINCALN